MTAATPQTNHPLAAVAALEAAKAVPLKLVVLRDGAYVRLTAAGSVVFRSQSDPGDSIDRIGFDWHTHVALEDSVFTDGPEAALVIILQRLKHARENPTYKTVSKSRGARS